MHLLAVLVVAGVVQFWAQVVAGFMILPFSLNEFDMKAIDRSLAVAYCVSFS
jgi:hypothetical protein